jgi:hypothetical protein
MGFSQTWPPLGIRGITRTVPAPQKPLQRPVQPSTALTVRLEERDRRIIARALEFTALLGDGFDHPTHRQRQLMRMMLDGIDD